MNKKVLALTLILLAIPLLTVLPVQAEEGKGTEKLYFKLYMEGTTVPPPERVWTSDDVTHARGLPWMVTGAFYVWIGEGGSVETITKAYLSYSGSLDVVNRNLKTNEATVLVRETITIWADPGKTILRGTLEILAVDRLDYGPPILGTGTFVGHGTGEFEGVKVEGTDSAYVVPPLAVTREGTVMGWPT